MSLGEYTIISLAVQKSGGGPTKTIGAFKRALNAELYSFCDPSRLKDDPLSVPGANPVNAVQLPFFRQFMWPSSRSVHAAEMACKRSTLISCHSFYRFHTLWMNQMFEKYQTPYWFVPHGILDPWVMEYGRPAKKLFWKFGGQRFLENASTVICSSRAEKEKAERFFDLPHADIVPWPVDLVDVDRQEERRVEIRKQLGIPEEDLVLIYFGRLHHMKRPLETIRALGAASLPSVHLIVVGNEQTVTLQDCDAVSREYGMSDRVHLVGAVYGDAKYDYLHASDAYISLSHRENFNHTAAESLAAGVPVILSPGNDLQSEISDERCSWAVRGNEIEDGARAIDAFATCSRDELKAMGLRGREWVERELSFESFSSKLNAVALRCSRK